MFKNLLAEMARAGANKKEMADVISSAEWTFNRKLNGISQFTLEEMFKIQNFLGQENNTLDYLFKKFDV